MDEEGRRARSRRKVVRKVAEGPYSRPQEAQGLGGGGSREQSLGGGGLKNMLEPPGKFLGGLRRSIGN